MDPRAPGKLDQRQDLIDATVRIWTRRRIEAIVMRDFGVDKFGARLAVLFDDRP